ncbi:MAG: DNA polymerase III subunit delta [Bacilli bacterium]|nr:DNA polymerase III subunit delta [Bacilli bacterium]
MAIEEIYLFTGTEEVRNRTKMDRILSSMDEAKTSVTRYDADFISIGEIIEDALTIPFLSEKKVIIVKNPRFLTKETSPMKHDTTTFVKYLKNPSDTTVLMIDAVGMVLDNDNEAVKACKKYAYIVDTQELETVEYKAWVKRLFVLGGIDIRDDALNLLIEYVKKDSVRMEQEVNKLISYVGSNSKVTESDVKELVIPNIDDAVFLLIRAIVAKDKKAVLKIYNSLANNTQDIMGVIAMVSSTFVDLYKTAKLLKEGYKQGEIASLFKISNGRAYYLVNDAKNFSIDALEEYILKLSNLDYQIKSGQIDKNLGIELLLLGM